MSEERRKKAKSMLIELWIWIRFNSARFAARLIAWLVLLTLLWALIDGQYPGGYFPQRTETKQLLLLLITFGLSIFLHHTASGTYRTLTLIWSQLSDNLLKLTAWLLLLGLAWALIDSQFGGGFVAQPGTSQQLYLVAGILVVAIVLQHSSQIFGRLKKVGPVELFAKDGGHFVENLLDRKAGPEMPQPTGDKPSLSGEDQFRYDQANLLISTLQFSKVEQSSLASSRRLHALLLKLGGIALELGEWAMAVDRLEFLIKISDGGFEPCETYFRCGEAYKRWARTYKSDDRNRKKLLRKALELMEEALAKHKNDYRLYFLRGYVQDALGMPRSAIASNDAALKLRHQHAQAKYNKAIAQINSKQKRAAMDTLEDIVEGDDEFERTMEEAQTDSDLQPLRDDPDYRDKLQDWLVHPGSSG